MNRIITFLIFFLIVLLAFAQEKADIVVSYDYTYPTTRDKIQTTPMTLLASPDRSKYFNGLSLWIDSLKSTPEGKAQYMEILKQSCLTIEPDGTMSWDLRKGPTKTVYTYIFTDNDAALLTVYGKWGDDLGFYTEPLAEIEWNIISDSTATMLGYECIMAETDYHGRHWKAWFTPEIPVCFGPWKLHGLPGLILKATCDGAFSFIATGLESTDREMTTIYSPADYELVDRKKAQAQHEYHVNNAEAIFKAQNGGNATLTYQDDEGNLIDAPVYNPAKHSIEPDYKN
ncbi:MAG: GLPGLI family protein [Paramuribaculum sp.]|nr:GLPGLI family protein [Paramuribaculum sp.]